MREQNVKPENIAILSQYRAQINLITEKLKETGSKEMARVNVTTVIKSQGIIPLYCMSIICTS